MRALMVGLDPSVVGKSMETNTITRIKGYADLLGHIDDIVLTDGISQNFGNLVTFPSSGAIKPVRFLKGLGIGLNLLKKNNYDVFIAQDPVFTALLLRLLKLWHRKVTLVIHLHGDVWEYGNIFERSLAESNIKIADGLKVNTEDLKRKLMVRCEVEEDRVRVIPTPVMFQDFDLTTVDPVGLPKDGEMVLYVGRLEKEKNLSLLLEAWILVQSKFSTAKLIIVGEGSLKQELQGKASGIPNIVFIGGVPHKDLAGYYRRANFLVLPSSTETYGKVILEAAYFKKPTVATMTSGPKSLITNRKNGLLVSLNDSKELAYAISELLGDKNFSQELGENASVSLTVDFEKGVDQVVGFWKDIVKRRRI